MRRLATMLALLLAAPSPAGAAASRDSTARDTTAAHSAPRDTTHRSVVPADSLPSSDARAVLRTIPEPLPPGERVPPPASPANATPGGGGPAAAAPADTGAAAPKFAPPDTTAADTTGVPTPAPTAPLGEGPEGPRRNPAAADSAASAPPPAAPPAATPPAALPAAADTCWRLQIGAFAERTVAESHRSAAVSQLLVAMTIESDHGRWKIRSSDCLTHVAADALRARALESGFRDAFLIRMSANGEAVPVGAPAAHAAPAAPAKKPAVKRRSHAPAGAVPAARTAATRKKTVRK